MVLYIILIHTYIPNFHSAEILNVGLENHLFRSKGYVKLILDEQVKMCFRGHDNSSIMRSMWKILKTEKKSNFVIDIQY